MQNLKRTATKFIMLFSLASFTTSTFAAGATVTFGSANPTSVPTLSSTMLIILSLLLFVVAVKVSGQKGSKMGKFFVLMIGVGALSAGTIGLKVLPDANAGLTSSIPAVDANNGNSFRVEVNQTRQFQNVAGEDLPFSIVVDNNSRCLYVNSERELFELSGSTTQIPSGETENGTIDSEFYITIACVIEGGSF